MPPVAKTKSQEIIEFLGSFKNRSKSNAFVLRDYKQASRKLCEAYQTDGFIALGAIACLERDFASMHKYHQQALNCSFNSNHALKNYAISLNKSCLWWQSSNYLERAHNNEPSDLEVLDALILNCYILGNFQKADELISSWEKLNLGITHRTHQTIVDALKVLQDGLIKYKEIENVIRIVGETLSVTDVIIDICTCNVIREEDNVFINYDFKCANPEQDVTELENMVDESIIRNGIARDVLDHLTINFVYPELEYVLQSFEENMLENSDALIIPDARQLKRIEDLIDGVELD